MRNRDAEKHNPSSWRWWHIVMAAGWIAIAVVAVVYLSRPNPPPSTLPGWTLWTEPGATRALAMSGDTAIAGGVRGLFRLRLDGTAERLDIEGLPGRPSVYALLRDNAGRLWVGHDRGLSCFESGIWTTLTQADGLPHERVWALARQRDGSLWVGTTGGAVHFDLTNGNAPIPLATLTEKDGLLHETVSAIVEDPDGGVWFGTYAAPEGGLSRLHDGRRQHWTVADGLPHPNVTSLLVGSDGRLWAGCGLLDEGGAAVFSRDESGNWSLETVLPRDELAGRKVRSLFEDSDGRLWFGSEYDGLTVRADRRTIAVMSPLDGLPSWEIMTIAQSRDRAMWFGTLAGTARLAPETLNSFLQEQSNGE